MIVISWKIYAKILSVWLWFLQRSKSVLFYQVTVTQDIFGAVVVTLRTCYGTLQIVVLLLLLLFWFFSFLSRAVSHSASINPSDTMSVTDQCDLLAFVYNSEQLLNVESNWNVLCTYNVLPVKLLFLLFFLFYEKPKSSKCWNYNSVCVFFVLFTADRLKNCNTNITYNINNHIMLKK